MNGLDLVGHDSQSSASNVMTEELDLVHEQLAFALLGVQMALLQSGEHRGNIVLVLLQRRTVDDDVVEEHEDATIEQVAERAVHQMLERGRRVREAHWQHCPLEVAVSRAERGLVAIALSEEDLIEAGAQIDLAEVFGSLQPIEQIVRERQRIAVADCSVVEPAVVDAEAEGAVLLLGEDDVGAPRRLGWAQTAAVQILLKLLLQLVQLLRRHSAERPRIRLRVGLELNLVHDSAGDRRSRREGRQLVREHGGELCEQLLSQLVALCLLDGFGLVGRSDRAEEASCCALRADVDEVSAVLVEQP